VGLDRESFCAEIALICLLRAKIALLIAKMHFHRISVILS